MHLLQVKHRMQKIVQIRWSWPFLLQIIDNSVTVRVIVTINKNRHATGYITITYTNEIPLERG